MLLLNKCCMTEYMDGKGKLDTFLLPLNDASIANICLSVECPGSSACSHCSMLLMDSRWPEVSQGPPVWSESCGNKLKV